mmetsp:Transcript_68625/g.121230  ORF Transcript_68625/g.121230 Transcript_68625/m.121230 type:complete len:858 (+) Transcript_68625:146-2719(+)
MASWHRSPLGSPQAMLPGMREESETPSEPNENDQHNNGSMALKDSEGVKARNSHVLISNDVDNVEYETRDRPVPRASEGITTAKWTQGLERKSQFVLNELEKNNGDEEVTFDDVVTARKAVEEELQHRQLRFLLVPGNRKLTCWHGFMSTVVIIAVVLAPADMAFSYTDFFKGSDWFLMALDVLFLLDMGLKFFVARTGHGRLVTDHKVIAVMYLKTWFIPDLLINFPWSLALSHTGGSKLAKVLKLPKALRVTRLLRVAGEEAHYFGTAANIAGIILMAHYCSCIWVMIFVDCASEDAASCPYTWTAYWQGFSIGMSTIGGTDSWLRLLREPSTVFAPRDPAEASLNDIRKTWGVESDLFAVCSCLIGICLVGVLFSSVSHAMDAHGSHTRLFRSRINNLQVAAQQHNISEDLFKRLKRHYYYVWSCGSDTAKAILEDTSLSVDLRRQLALCFYGHLLAQVPFLEEADPAFIRQLCEFVEMEIFAAGDRIASAGEAATELYFIAVGKVQIVLPPEDGESEEEGEVMTILDEGSFFGELGLLFPDSQTKVNVNAITAGKLLVVPRGTLEYFCTEELLDTFRSVAMERLRTQPHLAQIMKIEHDDILSESEHAEEEQDNVDEDRDQAYFTPIEITGPQNSSSIASGGVIRSPRGSGMSSEAPLSDIVGRPFSPSGLSSANDRESKSSPRSSQRSSNSQMSNTSLFAMRGSIVPALDGEMPEEREDGAEIRRKQDGAGIRRSLSSTQQIGQPGWVPQRRIRASTMMMPGSSKMAFNNSMLPASDLAGSSVARRHSNSQVDMKSAAAGFPGLDQKRMSDLQTMGSKMEAKLEQLAQTFSSLEFRIGTIDSRIAVSQHNTT